MAAALKQAAALVQNARGQVDNAIANPELFTSKNPLTAEEEAHRDSVRDAAMDALSTAIATVKRAQEQNKNLEVKKPAQKPAYWKTRAGATPVTMIKTPADSFVTDTLLQLQVTDTQPVDTIAQDLSAIEPVMDGFNSALAVDNISQWSATLESVPMLSIQLAAAPGQSSQVYYTATSINASGSDTVDTWQPFYQLPAEPASGDTCHCFSYLGDLYAAVGTAIYQKTVKNINDPSIAKAATDNWTLLYNSDWPLIDSACLPTNNAASLIQFNTFNTNGTVKLTGLIQLGSDSELSYFNGHTIGPKMAFTPWTFIPNASYPTAPKFEKLASWNNALWGYINNPGQVSTIYNINASAVAGSWSINYTTQMTDANKTDFSKYSIIDVTAVDSGLAVSLSDGNIWKWLLEPSVQESGKISANWQVYLKTGNNTSLGCASPGVVLDLKTLVTYLKSNYIQTQQDILGVIPTMESYCAGHGQLLQDILTYRSEFTNAPPGEQQNIAYEAGNEAIHQAQVYGRIITTQMGAINDTVTLMGRESSQVNSSLQVQLDAIGLQLTQLKSTLQSDEATLSKLEVGFWCSMAASFAGLGCIIAALLVPEAAPVLVAIGGLLIIGGIVGMAVTGTKISTIQDEIAGLKAQIASYTTAQSGLTSVMNNMTTMNAAFHGLDGFWYSMETDAATVNVATPYGFDLMAVDPPTVTSAIKNNGNLLTALQNYVNVLGEQGITALPPPTTDLISSAISGDHDTVHQQLEATYLDPRQLRNAKNGMTVALLKSAEAKRKQGDIESWRSLLTQADVFNTKALRSLPIIA